MNHNCRQCSNEWLGRCFSSYNHRNDVSVKEKICPYFIDGRSPDKVEFDTAGQLENYLREYFYVRDFNKDFTRPKLRNMLEILFPHTAKQNHNGLAFTHMCKRRMLKHIEFYIKLHGLKCKK